VGSTLFVAHQHVAQLRVLGEFAVQWQDGATGDAEYYVYTLMQKGFADDLASREFPGNHFLIPCHLTGYLPALQAGRFSNIRGHKKTRPLFKGRD
jgi:hypothetical protein